MHILHLYKDYHPVLGGIENHVRVLAEAQAALGHRVTVLVCNPGGLTGSELLNGVEIVRARRLATVWSMPLSVHQPMLLARLGPDIVHVHSPYPLGETSALLLRRSARLVITHHADVFRQRRVMPIYAPILRRVLAASDAVIATSPLYVESSPWLHPIADHCRVIPLGVDEQRFQAVCEEPRDRARLLFVGKLRHYKGLDVLLRALTKVPGATLDVVGDGPMRGPWEDLAAELGLGDRIHFHGEVDDQDLLTHYRRAGLLVLPSTSRAEAFGTVLLEAMATGLPCVATELGTGTSWVVRDGDTGLVVPPADSQSLEQAIQTLIADEGRARSMGNAGRLRVEQNFTRAAMIAQTMTLYDEIASGGISTRRAERSDS